jgi:hypothetical protein
MIMIDKCNGRGCPLKDVCFRYTSPKVSPVQTIISPPFFYTDEGFDCEQYWGEYAEVIVFNIEWFFRKNEDNYLKNLS